MLILYSLSIPIQPAAPRSEKTFRIFLPSPPEEYHLQRLLLSVVNTRRRINMSPIYK